jgi:hypothetical protein
VTKAWTSTRTFHEIVTPLLVPVEADDVSVPATAGWFAQVSAVSPQLAVTRWTSCVRFAAGAVAR